MGKMKFWFFEFIIEIIYENKFGRNFMKVLCFIYV